MLYDAGSLNVPRTNGLVNWVSPRFHTLLGWIAGRLPSLGSWRLEYVRGKRKIRLHPITKFTKPRRTDDVCRASGTEVGISRRRSCARITESHYS
jgi:hypothetical protein